MYLIQQFLPGVLAAAFTTAALLAGLGWIWKRNSWGAAVAVGAGYASGHAVVAGWPAFPPHAATGWLAWFALTGAFLGVLDNLFRVRNYARGLLWFFLFAGFVRLMVQPRFQDGWTGVEGLLWVAGLAIATGFLSWSLEKVSKRQAKAISLPLTLTFIAVGTSAALMLSGSILLGQFASVLSAAVGSLFLVTVILSRTVSDGRGATPVAALLLASLWISGYFYAELPAESALLFTLTPAFSLGAFAGRLTGWKATLAHAGIVCASVLAAVLLAWRASPPFPY